jgi:hypothetical protein
MDDAVGLGLNLQVMTSSRFWWIDIKCAALPVKLWVKNATTSQDSVVRSFGSDGLRTSNTEHRATD